MRTALPLAACLAIHVWSLPAPLLAAAEAKESALKVVGLRTEYKENPLGIDARKPRLSWQLRPAPRRPPIGLRDPRRAERARRARRKRLGVDLGPRGLGRVHPARLRGAGAAVRAAVPLAGPRLGRRAATPPPGARPPGGRWACSSRPTGRRAGSSPTCRRTSKSAGPAPLLRRDVQARRRRRARAGLRHEPRPLRAAPQRPARGRPALHPGLDELQQAPAVPDLRRDILAEDRATTRWASCSATAGIGATSAWEDRRNLYGDRLALLGQIEITYKDGRKENGRHRRGLEGRDGPHPDVRDLPRRDLRRAPREGGLDHAPASTTRRGRG